jgi:hypothetical protein
MYTKEFLSIIFKAVWTWIIGGVFIVIGIAVFFCPDLGLILNWPSMSQKLPWWFWVSIAFFIVSLGMAWEAASRIRKEPPELKQLGAIRKEGVGIRNKAYSVTTQQEVEQFIKEYDEWNNRMLLLVKKLSPAMASDLEILDTFSLTIRPTDVNDAHSKYLSILSEKLTRLSQFITTFTLAYHNK